MSGPDDKAALIVAIARTGDRAAFSNLFMFFAPRVKSYLLRLGMGNGEAEDLAQETLLTVWRKAASFDPERAGASTWIFTIARNLRLDAARRAVGAKIYAEREAIEQRDEMEVSAAELFIVAEDCARVKGALALLPHEQAEIVRLSFFEEKPHSDIAQVLDLPLGTVKSRLRLAMARLRAELDKTS